MSNLTHCSDCGQPLPVMPQGHVGATGYAIRSSDNTAICYPCADRIQREELKTATRFSGYISSDGKSITTWTGGHLMHITGSQTRPKARPNHMSLTRTWVNATDPDGGRWYGNGDGPGMCINLRKRK